MDDVRKLVVLSNELLDAPQVELEGTPADPLELAWWAYARLEEAGSASFRLSGGECSHTFGVRRGPIEIAIGDFRLFKDDPALLHLNIHPRQFYVAYSQEDEVWTQWK